MPANRKNELRTGLKRQLTERLDRIEDRENEEIIWLVQQLENYLRRWINMTDGMSRYERYSAENDLWSMVDVGFEVVIEVVEASSFEEKGEVINALVNLKGEILKEEKLPTASLIELTMGEIYKVL